MARAGGFAAVAGLAAAAVLAAAAAVSADTVTFGPNSPAEPFHPWTVPAKVCSATFDLYGAEGSSGNGGGAHVTTALAVMPGSLYYVFVGSWGVRGRGGYNGGGGASGGSSIAAGVGGGGATDVRTGPSLTERILVAAGGGGDGGGSDGGAGGAGGLVGTDGGDAVGDEFSILGGGGGTAFSGGAFGAGWRNGAAGTLGGGGDGAMGVTDVFGTGAAGGGGGGGLYGGGGGGGNRAGEGAGGGGGGGSSLAAGGTVTTTSGGQGKAIITYKTSATCGGTGGGGGGGGGGPTGSGTDKTKPRLSGLSFSRHSFRAARSGASIAPDTKSTPKTGSRISFSLSETGKVRFTVERKTAGRKLRGRCVKPGKSPHGKHCTRWIAVKGSFSLLASAGKNTFIFRGRVGGKSLKPGAYRLDSRATDNAHNASAVKRKGFKIVT